MTFENIHNYYEKLVVDYLRKSAAGLEGAADQDYLEDVACVALNRLPTRYVRHDVDTAFYMSDAEHQTMQGEVEEAVADALTYVRDRRTTHGSA